MSWTAINTSELADRLRRIIRDAETASQAHANLMRVYRITGPAQRAEMFAILAAELIAVEMVSREVGK